MPRRIYVGPIDEIETRIGGVDMFVKRGDVIDVTSEQAAVLDQCPYNWATPRATTKKEGD